MRTRLDRSCSLCVHTCFEPPVLSWFGSCAQRTATAPSAATVTALDYWCACHRWLWLVPHCILPRQAQTSCLRRSEKCNLPDLLGSHAFGPGWPTPSSRGYLLAGSRAGFRTGPGRSGPKPPRPSAMAELRRLVGGSPTGCSARTSGPRWAFRAAATSGAQRRPARPRRSSSSDPSVRTSPRRHVQTPSFPP